MRTHFHVPALLYLFFVVSRSLNELCPAKCRTDCCCYECAGHHLEECVDAYEYHYEKQHITVAFVVDEVLHVLGISEEDNEG